MRSGSGRSSLALALGAALALLAVLSGLSAPAAATHEQDHRYFVLGTVTNLTGVALPGLTVRVSTPGATTYDPNNPEITGVTDSNGRYRILLHLHHLGPPQEDSGVEIIVTVGDVTKRAAATPTALPPGESSETTAWGYTTLDFQIDQPGPAPLKDAILGIPIVTLVAGIAVVAGATAAIYHFGKTSGRRSQLANAARARESVTKLPGVGRATSERLRGAGIETIPQLKKAEAAELSQQMGVSEGEAEKLIRKARTYSGR